MTLECKIRIGNGRTSKGTVAIKTNKTGNKFMLFKNTGGKYLEEFRVGTEIKNRFMDQGKITFNFKYAQPPMVVFLEGSSMQNLNKLIKQLKSEASVSQRLSKDKKVAEVLQESLQVLSLDKMPTSKLPPTLKNLTISNIQDPSLQLILQTKISKLLKSSLPKLNKLDLSSNNLTAFPEKITSLKISNLNLSNNKMKSLPDFQKNDEFSKNVNSIEIANNLISVLPKSLMNVVNLKRLILTKNKIKAIPVHLQYLKNLDVLHLDKNLIRNIPFHAFTNNQYRKKFKELRLDGNFCFISQKTEAPMIKVTYNQFVPYKIKSLFDVGIQSLYKKFRKRTGSHEKTVGKLENLGVIENLEEFWSCKDCGSVYYGFDRAKKRSVRLYSLFDPKQWTLPREIYQRIRRSTCQS